MGFGLSNELIIDVFSTAEMRSRLDDKAMLQGWLDTESALARAQSALGVIPADAGDTIAKYCHAELYDMSALAKGILATGHPIVPVVRELIAKSGDAGRYVHWGATTQDIVDTGLILQCREGFKLVSRDIEKVLADLVVLAERYRDEPMVGRTHSQHALPITLGKKLAVWIDNLADVLERMRHVSGNLSGQFAGAVGTLAALEGRGPEVRDKMCELLGLQSRAVPWHTTRTEFRDIANALLEYGAAAERIGVEVVMLMASERKELSEPISSTHVGSSTMPQKRNPHTSEFMISAARQMRGPAMLLTTYGVHWQERDMATWALEWMSVPEIFCLASGMGQALTHIIGGLVVNTDNMRRVLDVTKGGLMAEHVMMRLAEKVGHEQAHHILFEDAGAAAKEDRPLGDVLMNDKRVTAHLSNAEIQHLLEPQSYLGDCGVIVDSAVRHAKSVLAH